MMDTGHRGVDERTLRWLTVALVTTATIESFESTAIQTIAPRVLADIGGQSAYAAVFGAFFLAQLVALVFGAWLAEGRGPVFAFVVGALLHAGGLLLCAGAWVFEVLLLGRVVQGLGTGVVVVAVYVLVGSCFPDQQRSRVLGLIVAAFAIPGLLGPVVAGAVAELGSWRLVIWPVVVVELMALVLLRPALRLISTTLGVPAGLRARSLTRIFPALALSVGVVTLVGLDEAPGVWRWPLFVAAVAVVLVSAVPLLPVGAWRLARGLPAAVLLRGLVGAPWLGVSFLVPLALVEGRGLSLAAAGAALSCGVAGYAGAGLLFGSSRLRTVGRVHLIRAGALLQGLGLVLTAVGFAPSAPLALVFIGWPVAGLGVCIAVNSLNVVVLGHAENGRQGTPASAMAIAESIGAAILAAVAGLGLGEGNASGSAVVLPTQLVMVGCAIGLAVAGTAAAAAAVSAGQ